MTTPEDPAVAEELAIVAIGQMIEAGDPVSEQDQLRFYKFKEARFSALLRSQREPDSENPMTVRRITNIYEGLEAARNSIKMLNKAIMNEGDMGTGSSVGEGTRRAARRLSR